MRANCRGSKLRLVLVLPILLYAPCLLWLGNVQQRRPRPLFTSSTSTHVNIVRSLRVSSEPAAEEEVEVDGSGSGCNDDWSDYVWSGGKAGSISIESASDNPPPAPLTIAKVQRIEICVAYCHADLRWLYERSGTLFGATLGRNSGQAVDSEPSTGNLGPKRVRLQTTRRTYGSFCFQEHSGLLQKWCARLG